MTVDPDEFNGAAGGGDGEEEVPVAAPRAVSRAAAERTCRPLAPAAYAHAYAQDRPAADVGMTSSEELDPEYIIFDPDEIDAPAIRLGFVGGFVLKTIRRRLRSRRRRRRSIQNHNQSGAKWGFKLAAERG